MGYFTKEQCPICGEIKPGIQLADGKVCTTCGRAASPIIEILRCDRRNTTVEQIRRAIETKSTGLHEYQTFSATRWVSGLFAVDETKKQWCIPPKNNLDVPRVYRYDTIQEFELLEDGETVTKGGLGRAVVGGIAFGGVGAIVGGVTGGKKTKTIINSLRVKVTIKDMNNPVVYIDLLQLKAKQGSPMYNNAYQAAQEILSILSLIVSEVEAGAATEMNQPASNVDQLIKLKELLDAGVLTQEEFESEKKKILST